MQTIQCFPLLILFSGSCRCQQLGHTHTNTFDGPVNHFQGACTYVLTDVYDPDCGGMIVWGKMKKISGHKTSTLRNITVWIIDLSNKTDAVEINQEKQIKVGSILLT